MYIVFPFRQPGPLPMIQMRRLLIAASLAALLLGCGPPPNITVTGTVLKDGKPLVVGPTGVLQVTLMPDVGPDEDYTSIRGECDREGHFTIQDVPPGKYKVGVEQFDPTPQVDKLNGAFHPGLGKFKREIDGKAPLEIELAKPEA
jgi:hypothetical protein